VLRAWAEVEALKSISMERRKEKMRDSMGGKEYACRFCCGRDCYGCEEVRSGWRGLEGFLVCKQEEGGEETHKNKFP
jgi:hypothetical protein